ncbi:hypothetical protein KSP39_PZI023272 [Platanthera zijinensis]|uniref:adenylate kinase n=1 Tax=Platanthera zijinensis TaxID=2320716 RepID=A0AAP0FV85_9ASPA
MFALKPYLAYYTGSAIPNLVPTTRDLLRAEIAADTVNGKLAKEYMEKGMLVPDEIVVVMVKECLLQTHLQENGWLLDGYPRSLSQAKALEDLGIRPDLFILLDIHCLGLFGLVHCDDSCLCLTATPAFLAVNPCLTASLAHFRFLLSSPPSASIFIGISLCLPGSHRIVSLAVSQLLPPDRFLLFSRALLLVLLVAHGLLATIALPSMSSVRKGLAASFASVLAAAGFLSKDPHSLPSDFCLFSTSCRRLATCSFFPRKIAASCRQLSACLPVRSFFAARSQQLLAARSQLVLSSLPHDLAAISPFSVLQAACVSFVESTDAPFLSARTVTPLPEVCDELQITSISLSGKKNFVEWVHSVRRVLQMKGLLHYLTKDTPSAPTDD